MKDAITKACEELWREMDACILSGLDQEVGAFRRNGHAEGSGYLLKYFYNCERPRLTVLTALAAGADQEAAKALRVVQRQVDVEMELEAVLPFPKAGYDVGDATTCGGVHSQPSHDFRAGELTEMKSWTNDKGEAAQVVWLDGVYQVQAPGGSAAGPASVAAQQLAYRAGTACLLQHSDLVVAIYDPDAEPRMAGTLETVQFALSNDKPVLAMLVKQPQGGGQPEVRMMVVSREAGRPLNVGSQWASASLVTANDWRKSLRERVHYLLALPHMKPAGLTKEDEERKKLREELLGETIHRLLVLYNDDPMHQVCRSWWRLWLFQAVWSSLLWATRLWQKGEKTTARSPSSGKGRAEMELQPYDKWYHRATLIADRYMAVYRGAFVLAFVLAAVATSAAVVGICAAWYVGHPPKWTWILLVGVELTILVTLLAMHLRGLEMRPQRWAVEFRFLGELLRPMEWLAPLATVVPAAQLPAHYRSLDPRQNWTQWLLRAVLRGQRMQISANSVVSKRIELNRQSARATVTEALKSWIEGQIHYHEKNHHRMELVENGLEKGAKTLLVVVLVCVLGAGGYKIFLAPDHGSGAPHHDQAAAVDHVAKDTGQTAHGEASGDLGRPLLWVVILSGFAAGLPAFIGALTAILFQSEAARLHLRSKSMVDRLEQAKTELLACVGNRTSMGTEAWLAAEQLRLVAFDMVAESGDWQALYQMHQIHAG